MLIVITGYIVVTTLYLFYRMQNVFTRKSVYIFIKILNVFTLCVTYYQLTSAHLSSAFLTSLLPQCPGAMHCPTPRNGKFCFTFNLLFFFSVCVRFLIYFRQLAKGESGEGEG